MGDGSRRNSLEILIPWAKTHNVRIREISEDSGIFKGYYLDAVASYSQFLSFSVCYYSSGRAAVIVRVRRRNYLRHTPLEMEKAISSCSGLSAHTATY